jgi:hypothetical protein
MNSVSRLIQHFNRSCQPTIQSAIQQISKGDVGGFERLIENLKTNAIVTSLAHHASSARQAYQELLTTADALGPWARVIKGLLLVGAGAMLWGAGDALLVAIGVLLIAIGIKIALPAMWDIVAAKLEKVLA